MFRKFSQTGSMHDVAAKQLVTQLSEKPSDACADFLKNSWHYRSLEVLRAALISVVNDRLALIARGNQVRIDACEKFTLPESEINERLDFYSDKTNYKLTRIHLALEPRLPEWMFCIDQLIDVQNNLSVLDRIQPLLQERVGYLSQESQLHSMAMGGSGWCSVL